MKKLPFLVLLLFVGFAMAQNRTQQHVDSLKRAIATQHGIDKINSCHNLYNYGEFEEVEKQARSIIINAKKNNEWKEYYVGYNLLIDALTATQKYEELQTECKKFYDEAKALNNPEGMAHAVYALAKTYMKQNRFEDAVDYFKECLNLTNKLDFNEISNVQVEAGLSIAIVLIVLNKFDEAFHYLQKADYDIKRWEEIEITKTGQAKQLFRFELYGYYIKYYLGIRNFEKTEYYYKLLEQTILSFPKEENSIHNWLYILRAEIFEVTGRYEEGLAFAEKAYRLMLVNENTSMNLIGVMHLRARLLCRLCRAEEGIVLYDSVLLQSKIIRDNEFNAQMDELRTVYEVDKHIAEKERVRAFLLFALGGCILLALTLGIWIHYSRTIVRKNRDLYLQIKEQDRLEEELDAERRRNLELRLLLKPDAVEFEESEDNYELFFGRLVVLMKEQRLFANFEVKRKDVAKEIGISDRGLHDCIKKNTGMSFAEYINALRLAYARELLSNMDDKHTIETIAFEAGFNSRPTFYRLFTEKYGLSPKQFRKLSKV